MTQKEMRRARGLLDKIKDIGAKKNSLTAEEYRLVYLYLHPIEKNVPATNAKNFWHLEILFERV